MERRRLPKDEEGGIKNRRRRRRAMRHHRRRVSDASFELRRCFYRRDDSARRPPRCLPYRQAHYRTHGEAKTKKRGVNVTCEMFFSALHRFPSMRKGDEGEEKKHLKLVFFFFASAVDWILRIFTRRPKTRFPLSLSPYSKQFGGRKNSKKKSEKIITPWENPEDLSPWPAPQRLAPRAPAPSSPATPGPPPEEQTLPRRAAEGTGARPRPLQGKTRTPERRRAAS